MASNHSDRSSHSLQLDLTDYILMIWQRLGYIRQPISQIAGAYVSQSTDMRAGGYPTRGQEFRAGMRATIPMVVGAIPFGVIFGAAAVSGDSGAPTLSPAGALGMSAFVFAGSAQFIAAALIKDGLSVGLIVLTTFIVNLRHALYSASLAPHMKRLPHRWLLPLAFWLTDESYAVVIGRFNRDDGSPHKHWFYFGSAVFMYSNWQLCTVIGVVAGRTIANIESWGLEFAMVVTFIGIVVPLVVTRPMVVSVIVAGGAALVFNNAPNNLGLMIASLLGIVAGYLAETHYPQAQSTPTSDTQTSQRKETAA